jgi:heptosyltransferase II
VRSLVVQTSFLGDVVLTTPLIAAVGARRGVVDVVTTAAGAALLANHPRVRRVIVYDKRGADAGVGGFRRLAARLRAEDYAVAYLAQGSVRSAMLAVVARIPERIGFDTSAGRALYTRRVAYRPDIHHAERLWRLAEFGVADESELRPRLYPGDAERAAVDALLASAGVAPDATLVALAPGSQWGTKRWPYYAELAGQLAARWPHARIVVIGGREDAESARAVAGAAPGAVDATGRLSLLGSAALLERCAVLVTNDSSPQHLASAVDTPTVTVFGPTVPEFGFGPLATRRATAGHRELACRPCDPHGPQRCPLKHWRCMREIGPELVAGMAEDVARG